MGGRILEYVTEVFLYYNFSIKQFIESLKVIIELLNTINLQYYNRKHFLQFCLLEHLYLKPLNCLCVAHESAQDALFDLLDEKTLEEITKLRSTNFKLKVDKDLKV